MQSRTLGRTGLQVSELGLGGGGLGGIFGEVSDEEAQRTVQAAVDAGPSCHHFGLAIHDYDPVAVEAELRRRGLDPEPDSKMAWTILDPDGLRVEIAAYGYPEHIGRDCGGSSETCPAAPG